MKVIVAGSRNFHNFEFVQNHLDDILFPAQNHDIEIVTGRCSSGIVTFTTKDRHRVRVCGVDGLAERYAFENGIAFKPFPADWDLGKKAGPIRNQEMAEYADRLIAFDSGGKGTANMIKCAKEQGLPTIIINI
jgi:hypothetical protein